MLPFRDVCVVVPAIPRALRADVVRVVLDRHEVAAIARAQRTLLAAEFVGALLDLRELALHPDTPMTRVDARDAVDHAALLVPPTVADLEQREESCAASRVWRGGVYHFGLP